MLQDSIASNSTRLIVRYGEMARTGRWRKRPDCASARHTPYTRYTASMRMLRMKVRSQTGTIRTRHSTQRAQSMAGPTTSCRHSW